MHVPLACLWKMLNDAARGNFHDTQLIEWKILVVFIGISQPVWLALYISKLTFYRKLPCLIMRLHQGYLMPDYAPRQTDTHLKDIKHPFDYISMICFFQTFSFLSTPTDTVLFYKHCWSFRFWTYDWNPMRVYIALTLCTCTKRNCIHRRMRLHSQYRRDRHLGFFWVFIMESKMRL